MKLRKLCCRALPIVTTVVALTLTQGGASASQLGTVPSENSVELPFKLHDGYLIIVEGQIGTQTNLKFILDTGASISIVDSNIANKLKLKRQPTESFNFDRKLDWEQASFPDIQFGPIKATNIVMLVGHLAEYSEFARNVDAIIGLDLLRLSNFSIDYAAGKVVFHSFGQGATVNSNEPLSKCLILELQVQGHPVRLVVDTGIRGILLFEERLRTTVPGLRITENSKVTIGGRLHAREATLKGVAIGQTIKDVSVFLTKSPAPEMLPGIGGVVGIAALNARRVNFDFITGALSWEGWNPTAGSKSTGTDRPAPSESQEVDAEVPFTMRGDYLIVVQAQIEGQRRMRFVLDTGATHSVLRSELAKVLELAPRSVRIVNLDGVLTENMVELTDFQLGPIRIAQLPMMSDNLGYLHETAPGVDGVIGLDVLRLRSFSIDFGRRKITFGPPRMLRSRTAMEMDQSYLAVEVRMMNRPVRLLVDSGVQTILLYRDRMGERLPNVKIEKQIRGASLSGSASLDVVTLPPVQLNGTELEQRAVLLRNSPAGFLPGVDGYLSTSSLRAQRISFDFERSLLSWE